MDCDNTTPEILEFALRVVAQFGRVVLRRGYGNHTTLANKWQKALVRQAFTPCLQYQYASGKNTADIALALDAIEAMFDQRADTFCLVTSDSDFAYVCRKLSERGATVCIVGETRSPDALRNASDQFFEWVRPVAPAEPVVETFDKGATKAAIKPEQSRTESRPVIKRRPRFIVEAVTLLASDTPEGKVHLGPLGQYLKRTDPVFSPQSFPRGFGVTLTGQACVFSRPCVKLSGKWALGSLAAPQCALSCSMGAATSLKRLTSAGSNH